MLKNRNILILAAVLVVLLGLNLLQKANYRKSTSQPASTKVVPVTVTADELERITLGQGEGDPAVELVSTPTGWVVTSAWDAPANPQRIDSLLSNLSGLSGEFRSDSEAVLADYGLSDQDALLVRGYGQDGEVVLAVDIGDKPENSQGNFVRRPDSSAVYLTPTNLLAQMGLYNGPGIPDFKHFLDLQAVQEDRLTIDRIILTDQDGTRELVKEFSPNHPQPGADDTVAESDTVTWDRTTWEWKLAGNKPRALAKTKADALMGAAVNIRAVNVDDPSGAGDFGLEPPSRTATLVREDGSDLVLEFGNSFPAEGDRQAGTWMRIHNLPQVWIVTDYTVNNIFKPTDDLLPDQE